MRAESHEVKRDRCYAPDITIDALYRESVQRTCQKRPGLFKTGKLAIHRSLRRSCFPDGTHAATTRPASLHLRGLGYTGGIKRNQAVGARSGAAGWGIPAELLLNAIEILSLSAPFIVLRRPPQAVRAHHEQNADGGARHL